MLSHSCAEGDLGKSEQTQASPSDVPSICVLEGGQIEDNPSDRTDHSVVIGTMGTDEASVAGCERR